MMNNIFRSLFILLSSAVAGQQPVILADINIPSRQEAEVNEPGYLPWPLPGGGESLQASGVTFTLSGTYTDGWYKAGVQAPYYARLANDGLVTGDSTTLTISGLPAGIHSLLTFHNTFDNPDNNTFSPMDIYLNGELVYNDLIQSNRVTSNALATTAYIVFETAEGEYVSISIIPETSTDATQKIATLCGFELNTPNAMNQATGPVPGNGDKHVNADSGFFDLSWTPAESARSHDIYFGISEQSVIEATVDSAAFQGNGTDTVFTVAELYSLQVEQRDLETLFREVSSAPHSTLAATGREEGGIDDAA